MIKLWFEENIGIPIWEFFHERCSRCGGCGSVHTVKKISDFYYTLTDGWRECPTCKGKGYLTLKDRFYI